MALTSQRMIVIGCLLSFACTLYAASDWLKGSTDEKLKTLAEIQPGLGTVMIEYGNRYSTTYYAAKGGNWDLAAYQIKEMREIQRVGETTRPARMAGLTGFERSYLDPLDAAVKARDWKKFDSAFRAGITGCNECHVATGFPYITYQLPPSPPSSLSLKP